MTGCHFVFPFSTLQIMGLKGFGASFTSCDHDSTLSQQHAHLKATKVENSVTVSFRLYITHITMAADIPKKKVFSLSKVFVSVCLSTNNTLYHLLVEQR